ncbi:hypothetical protein F5144DRAFT_385408 [Chaetomium tenue]|uniref:Uncharacterized protein n=1 Tax=Chaetomium tenue TaxID=1854479 RepID=A0ACB7NV13_9PEZI|nr:hypothetical protein F5144DRAFT_385408 [Chaetomium globosum]
MANPTTRLTTALPLILALLAASGQPVAARTDYAGCVSTALPAAHTTIWYVPGTGELCEPVDCGGGRAPPKTVPGCPAYKGTETVTPKFWEGFEGAQATPTAVPGGAGDDGEDSEGEGEGGDGEGEDGGNGVGVSVGVTGGAKGTVTVTLGGGTAAVSRTASRTKDVEETGAAGAGGDSDDEDEDDGEGGKSSAATATGGGRKPMATLTQVMTAVETVDGVVRPVPTGEGDGEGVAAQSTVSLAAAVPTAAVVGKAVFGVVAAGVAAAGLVLA